ncbi:MAG: dihydrolipoyl dehydrogenase [Peptoniphilaceae bacterium]|nr:dihydrolipoyl dehydrogenase [Peptoniphilaceae bacterium]MDD7383821.1 dihydrolipoyl dehydrogenase [Peptoniphilaceae bacterium]MDY3737602.1 dihydrolipoyl dehydrogenase [Peptoniphilaceae bacterium]
MFDVVVIGAGPGGYVAAIKAAQSGFKTALVEKKDIGGTCLNRGCIPTKALLHSSDLYEEIKSSNKFGLNVDNCTFDFQKIMQRKDEAVLTLVSGVSSLLDANKVKIYNGVGRLNADKTVSVNGEVLETKYVILASGSKPSLIPIEGIDLEGVVTSDELLNLKSLPESLTIIGGGVIGVEFAQVFAQLGVKVTIVEALKRLVPVVDKEVGRSLQTTLKKKGVDIHTSSSVTKIEKNGDNLSLYYTEKGKEHTVESELVLCAVGRKAQFDDLFADGVEVEMERGRIVIDDNFQTSMKDVYAIGDIVKGPQLAHKASAEAIYVIEKLAGNIPDININVVPSCIYTTPEISSVGLSEEEAKEAGIEYKTSKYLMTGNAKNIIVDGDRGFIKLVSEKETGKILGAVMFCERASDMIGEITTAITNEMTVKQLLSSMRAHPSFNEGLREALELLEGNAIHVVPR